MSKKQYFIDDIGTVHVTKRRKSRRLRLRIASDGNVHVSIPYWVPYRSALSFVTEKKQWIMQYKPKKKLLVEGDIIGKYHRIVIKRGGDSAKLRARVAQDAIVLTLPAGENIASGLAQAEISKAAKRALTKQAEQILPNRVEELSRKHDFNYQKLRFRTMKSRWGSCSSTKEITLNAFLMQLDDDLIDYVILHELLHTTIPSHGKVFWQELEHYVDQLAAKRKRMKSVEPTIMPCIADR